MQSVAAPTLVRSSSFPIMDFCRKVEQLAAVKSAEDGEVLAQELLAAMGAEPLKAVFKLLGYFNFQSEYREFQFFLMNWEMISFGGLDFNDTLAAVKAVKAQLAVDITTFFPEAETVEQIKKKAVFLDEYYQRLALDDATVESKRRVFEQFLEVCTDPAKLRQVAIEAAEEPEGLGPLKGCAQRYLVSLNTSVLPAVGGAGDDVVAASTKLPSFDEVFPELLFSKGVLGKDIRTLPEWAEFQSNLISDKKTVLLLRMTAYHYPDFYAYLKKRLAEIMSLTAARPYTRNAEFATFIDLLMSETSVEDRFLGDSGSKTEMFKPQSLRAFFVVGWVNQVKQLFPAQLRQDPSFHTLLIQWACQAFLFPEFDLWLKDAVIRDLAERAQRPGFDLSHIDHRAIQKELSSHQAALEWSEEELRQISDHLLRHEIRSVYVDQKINFLRLLLDPVSVSDTDLGALRICLSESIFYRGNDTLKAEIAQASLPELKVFLKNALEDCLRDGDQRVLAELARVIDNTRVQRNTVLARALYTFGAGKIFALAPDPARGFWQEVMALESAARDAIGALETAAAKMTAIAVVNPLDQLDSELREQEVQGALQHRLGEFLNALNEVIEELTPLVLKMALVNCFPWGLCGYEQDAKQSEIRELAKLDDLKNQLCLALTLIQQRGDDTIQVKMCDTFRRAAIDDKCASSKTLLGVTLRTPTKGAQPDPTRGRWQKIGEIHTSVQAKIAVLQPSPAAFYAEATRAVESPVVRRSYK